ncbi:MAG: hypothetical protein LUF26_08760, partial [Firmicutes bacterium]|nr:hypothetical protein [Bacillota bacterium]
DTDTAQGDYIDVEVYYYPEDENGWRLFSDKTMIPNAEVTVRGITKTTDENGIVRFYDSELTGEGGVSAKADGFFDYESDLWIVPVNGNAHICMTEKDPDKIYLTSLTAENKNGTEFDIKAGRSITVAKTNDEQYTFTYSIDWNGHEEGKVYLKGESSGNTAEFSGNTLTISPSAEFDVGEAVMFVAYTADGQSFVEYYCQISITALDEAYSLPFDPIESDEISKIPLLDSAKLKIAFGNDIDEMANEVKLEDNKLILKFTRSSKDKEDAKIDIFDENEVKVSMTGKLEIPLTDSGTWSGEVSVKFSDAEKLKDEDKIHIANITYNTGVVVAAVYIPLTGTIDVSGALEAKLGIDGPLSDAYIYGSITPEVAIDLFGGLGYSGDTYEVKGGIYLNLAGKLEAEAEITPQIGFELSPSLEGKAGLKASVKVWAVKVEPSFEVGSFKWTKDGLKATWLGDEVTLTSADNQWELIGRAYLDNGGGFAADEPQIELLDLDVTNKSETLIYENIFENSEAVLQNIDGTSYLIYTIDDTSREEQNGLNLVYSVENSDGTWTEPQSISDDGTLDSVVSADGGFVIWEDMREELSSDVSELNEILPFTEISAAYFNGSEWVSERLSDNEVYDFSPVISASGNTAAAVWLSNTAADFSAQSGVTSLNYAVFDGTSWSDVVTIDDIGEVTRIAANWIGIDCNIVYEKNDTLYTVTATGSGDNITFSSETALGYDGAQTFALGNCGGEAVMAYVDSDNTLKIVEDVFGAPIETAIESDINMNSIPVIRSNDMHTYVCWTDRQDGYNTLCGVRYDNDNGAWSEKITFVNDEANISSPDISVNDDGSFTASYFKTGDFEVQDDGSYTSGAVDLYVNAITPTYNIAIDADTLTYDEEAYAETGEAEFAFDVCNIGEKAVDGFDVELYEDGELMQTFEDYGALKAGETQSVSVSYTPDKTDDVKTITLKLIMRNEEDFDESDNSAEISIGAADMTVSNAYFTYDEGRQYFLNSTVTNEGSVTADNVVIQVHKNSTDGEVVYEAAIDSAAPDEEMYICTPLTIDADAENYVVTVSADEDSNEYNNFSIAVLDFQTEDVGISVTSCAYDSATNAVKITMDTANSYSADKSVAVIMAAYDKTTGELKKLSIDSSQTISAGTGSVEKTFDCDGLSGDYTFKLMSWYSLSSMTPVSDAYETTVTVG